jgi:hypothetical protein
MQPYIINSDVPDRSFTHIIRCDSFWEGTIYTQSGAQIKDNHGNLIASFRDYDVEPEARWEPILTHYSANNRHHAVNMHNRAYYFYNMVDTIYRWKTLGHIDETRMLGFCRLISLIVHCGNNLTWNLDYYWPGYYFPARGSELFPCNIQGFISQFPSDPFIIDLTVEDSESIGSFSSLSFADYEDREDWERLLDHNGSWDWECIDLTR